MALNIKDDDLAVAHVVGYMLKVLKNKMDTAKFHNEFAAIRHGDYDKFISLIKEPILPMVICENGVIRNRINSVKEECDIIALFAATPSLYKFYHICYSHYGDLVDTDFNDEIYRKLSVFEIRIRMHANIKGKVINSRDELMDIINKLSVNYTLTETEINLIHDGRRFLNKIKHHNVTSTSWKSNISLFENAYQLLDDKKIRII